MAQTKMADPMDDIAQQARQGSVAAIIQVLNEQLADSGVRTRAILAEGVLQLLCEAATPEQLEQSTLVKQVRQILEGISPRNIRRVNINSRIVKEQQLLWLEEISRDPENQLLWSEEITLAKPNLLKQLARAFKSEPQGRKKTPPTLPKQPIQLQKNTRPFWLGILGGASLVLLLGAGSWMLYQQFGVKTPLQPQASSRPADPFVEAVRLAESAVQAGKTAQSSAQWLDLAAKWEKAADLMSKVPSSDSRYQTAQNRQSLYRQNSEKALQQARQKKRSNF